MSRVERLLKAIIQNGSYDEERLSRVEDILYSFLKDNEYTEDPMSRMEALLLVLKESGLYSGDILSRIEAILKSKIDGTEYPYKPESRIEELLLIWDIISEYEVYITGVPPLTLRNSVGKDLVEWSITGNTKQAWTPSPEPQVGNNKLDNSKIEKSSTVTNFTYTDSSVSFSSMTVGSAINSAEIKAGDTSYAFSFSGDTSKVSFALKCYDSSHTYLGDANKLFNEENRAVMTTLSNTAYIRLVITTTVQGNVSLTNLMLNKGGTIMAFEPFKYLPNTGPCEIKGVGDNANLISPPSKYGININTGLVDTNESRQHGDEFVPVESNSEYYIKTDALATAIASGSIIWILGYDKDKNIVTDGTFNPSYKGALYGETFSANLLNSVIRTTATTKYIRWYVTSAVTNWDDVKIMLNKGSTPIPHGYKIDVVARGKNLFDESKITHNTRIISTTGVISELAGCYCSEKIRINPNTRYILSGIGYLKAYTEHAMAFFNQNGDFINKGELISKNNINEFTTPNDAYYVIVNGVLSSVDICQLELGSTATDYEPYKTPITTQIYLSSPLMADEVFDSTGKREVEWGVKVFTGDEDSIIQDSVGCYYRIDTASYVKAHCICSHIPYYSEETPDKLTIINLQGSFRFIQNGLLLNDFKAFLKSEYDAGHPVTVCYPLATPTTETVDVPQIPTLKGNCTIDVNTEVKPTDIGITYLSSEK